ncbi:IS110 family transposase [Sediminivirga luteola]|nr:IS110 family transposase [Sediminivirga luteola]MCI2266961.1 IS110 family transposase [Sediminivirga luteola]
MVNDKQIKVYAGIDTHADTHHIAVIDAAGRRLADVQCLTSA